ncbi:hypothetical protein [Massilia sp. IC2-476]|uniref:hypothetical protein n=1 Tax=Massilia sp. IC2-476 TaxID=2887199 RepID=UPI001D12632A|nr:hypothetical protein [Massilia sp. IC2-476]MCC2973936.1 hypothetical protein [Massilia sp. IC2-476]
MTAHPFFLLLRSRRAWFRRESFGFYLRYAHVLGVVVALCGPMLLERPELPAEPILHFWREPGSVGANAAWAGAWLAIVALWARIHRGFIAGGALAAYARSLPLDRSTLRQVDTAMLLVGLQVFVVPVALTIWQVAAHGGGAPWFILRAVLLALLSFGAAQAAAMRPTAHSLAMLCVGYGVLAGCGAYGPYEPLVLGLASSAVLLGLRSALAADPVPHAPGRARRGGGLRIGGMAFLLAWQANVLVRGHAHAGLPRILLAAALQVACLWMIFSVGKLAESSAFLKVGCWMIAAVLSGLFHVLWSARAPLAEWLRSLPFATLRVAVAEQGCVLGLHALILGAGYAACQLQGSAGDVVAAQLLRHGTGSLATLALLGAPIIQRHKDGVLLKFVVLVATFLIL